jgi:hypothetical protein
LRSKNASPDLSLQILFISQFIELITSY